MPIAFQNWPWLLLLVPVAGWLVWVERRTLTDLSPGRRRAALGLRLLIAGLLVFALAGATLVRSNDALAVWYLVDSSDSIEPGRRDEAIKAIAKAQAGMRRSDRAGVILFGADAMIEAPLSDRLPAGRPNSTPTTAYTDIARALRLAVAASPAGYARRIVLLSDGNENLGSAAEEASIAAAEGIPVDVVPVEHARAKEALLERMILPAEVKIGEPFELRLVAASDTAQQATLRLFRNNAYIGSQKVALAPGKNVFSFNQMLEKAGFTSYEARMEAGTDTVAENNRALGFSLVRGKPRILYVEGDPGQEKYLASALRAQHVDADVTGPAGIPRNLAEFQNYDSILFSNVGAMQVTPQQMRMIQSNVRDLGQGFGMIGGDDSFGVGGYVGTPIEETLPVAMDVPKQKSWPSAGIAIVMDKSGSMAMEEAGVQKVKLAAEAAIAVVQLLSERDQIAVLPTDDRPVSILGNQMVSVRNKGYLIDQIASIGAGGGGIYCHDGLAAAYDLLATANTTHKHIILLADGEDSEQQDGCAALVKRMAPQNVTLTTVAIGRGPDERFLQQMANLGGGRFYVTESAAALPRIFTKEAMMVAKSLIQETPFLARVDPGDEVLHGIDWGRQPPLLGYVATSPKPLADVPMRTPLDDPLFAHWRYGLGRSIAFTSDCKARWAAQWLQWPGYRKFWAQAVRWTLRRGGHANFQTTVDIERGRGRIVVDAVDRQGEFVNSLDVRANVVRPDMTTQGMPLRQTGPGRYEGEFEATAIGAYMVNVTRSDQGALASQTAGIAISYPPEYRDLKTNDFLLTRIADRTGGRVLRDPAEVFTRERRPARVPVEIWPLLLLLALLLFPLDVAIRRVMLEPAEVWALARSHAGRLRLRRRKKAPARDATLGRLLDRKASAPTARPAEPPAPAAPAPPAPEAPRRPAVTWGQAAPEDLRRPAEPPAAAAPEARPAPKPPAGDEDDGLSPTERLLRAKRRAR